MESEPAFGDDIIDQYMAPFDLIYDNTTGDKIALYNDLNETENLTSLILQLQPYMSNRAMDDVSLVCLLTAYVVLIITGASGNGLVCMAVARKPAMRTARNVFIINLAISDLILCLFTMPFSLVEIMMKFWPLGIFTCKLVAGLQATSIFVSTISITAIALDRYHVIVYPTQDTGHSLRILLTLSCIWIIALLLSTPLFFFKTVVQIPFNLPWLESVTYCVERWPIEHGRGFYSVFSMFFQYLLPILIVSIAYARICQKLTTRMGTKGTKLKEKQARDKQRVKKTNILLISIALIFGISWMPLNILNVVADFYPLSNTTFRIIFACCHMAGMSSACSNPLLYGWLNENFCKEFKEILGTCTSSPKEKLNGTYEGTESFVLYTKSQTNTQQADTTLVDGVGVRPVSSTESK